MLREFGEFICMFFIVALLVFSVALIAGGVLDYLNKEECKIYSELKTKNGVMLVGKAVIPTTYQGRDCLVWENKE